MKQPQSPCKDCEDRHPGCHSACERYAAFREELDDYKEQLKNNQAEIEADKFLLRKYKRGTR